MRWTGYAVEPNVAKTSQSAPAPLDLMDSIEEFIAWVDQHSGSNQTASLSPVLDELRTSLPRALAITNALSNTLRNRGGGIQLP